MVWLADISDIEDLVVLAEKFHAVSPFADYKFSPQGTRSFLKSIIHNPNAVILMHEHGAIAGSVLELPMCDLRCGEELFWYAERNGLVLLNKYHSWLERRGVRVSMFSSIENESDMSIKVRAYLNRIGYETLETKMIRVID